MCLKTKLWQFRIISKVCPLGNQAAQYWVRSLLIQSKEENYSEAALLLKTNFFQTLIKSMN